VLSCLPVLSFSLGRRLVAVVDALSGMVNTDMLLLLCSRVINAGSLQMSYWKLQQHRNCESKLQRNHYRLCLNYLGYDLRRRITATSTRCNVHAMTSHSHYLIFQEYQRRIVTSRPMISRLSVGWLTPLCHLCYLGFSICDPRDAVSVPLFLL
jgi:hypothetical protein